MSREGRRDRWRVPVGCVTAVAVVAALLAGCAPDAGLRGSGRVVDEALPLPQGSPPVAFLIGAWADQGADEPARAASRLLGKPDWHHTEQVVFPISGSGIWTARRS